MDNKTENLCAIPHDLNSKFFFDQVKIYSFVFLLLFSTRLLNGDES